MESVEIVEFTIPPMFFVILVGVLIAWAYSYVIRARVHFLDPPAYVARDNQGRQVYVDFSFTWQIENISRWLLVKMTRTDIAGRLKTETHSALALVASYSCEGADRQRQRIARLVTKTVNSSVVTRYGVTCRVTIEHVRLEEGIQQQIDAAMTQLQTEERLGEGDARYIRKLLEWPENVVFDLDNPAVVTIIEAKLRAEALNNLGANIGEAIAKTLRGIREGGGTG